MQAQPDLRMTAQRRIILEELRGAHGHPTADEIYHRVRRKLPRISLGTVYRNLETLAAKGVIQRLDSAGGQRRFDGIPERHYHIRCLECGAVADISIRLPSSLKEMIEDPKGYEIKGARFELLGLCPVCRQAKPSTE